MGGKRTFAAFTTNVRFANEAATCRFAIVAPPILAMNRPSGCASTQGMIASNGARMQRPVAEATPACLSVRLLRVLTSAN